MTGSYAVRDTCESEHVNTRDGAQRKPKDRDRNSRTQMGPGSKGRSQRWKEKGARREGKGEKSGKRKEGCKQTGARGGRKAQREKMET